MVLYIQTNKIKQLQPPRTRLLYTEPITQVITNKKLHSNKNAFIFFLVEAKPQIIYLEYQSKRTRINTLLKEQTQEDDANKQFIRLLEQPQIIQDKQTTLFIIEIIYITFILHNIDLLNFITHIKLENLINYYF